MPGNGEPVRFITDVLKQQDGGIKGSQVDFMVGQEVPFQIRTSLWSFGDAKDLIAAVLGSLDGDVALAEISAGNFSDSASITEAITLADSIIGLDGEIAAAVRILVEAREQRFLASERKRRFTVNARPRRFVVSKLH